MNLIDILIIGAVALILGIAVLYIRSARKKGVKCIGCPEGTKCPGSCSGCSGNCSGSK